MNEIATRSTTAGVIFIGLSAAPFISSLHPLAERQIGESKVGDLAKAPWNSRDAKPIADGWRQEGFTGQGVAADALKRLVYDHLTPTPKFEIIKRRFRTPLWLVTL